MAETGSNSGDLLISSTDPTGLVDASGVTQTSLTTDGGSTSGTQSVDGTSTPTALTDSGTSSSTLQAPADSLSTVSDPTGSTSTDSTPTDSALTPSTSTTGTSTQDPQLVQSTDVATDGSTVAPSTSTQTTTSSLSTGSLAPISSGTTTTSTGTATQDTSLSPALSDPAPTSSTTTQTTSTSTLSTSTSTLSSTSPMLTTLAVTQSNPIVIENEKPGTPVSVWAIHGDLDAVGDSNIEGFATQISVDRGQTVSFKINTDATKYRIDIYRLGYYGGDGATLVTSINENLASPQLQPTALFDSTTNTVDAGNWAVSASWAIPSDATSGVYIAKLTRTDGTVGENVIPFIVRADGVASDVVFQTSDSTWQAYNPWGGYNFYQGPNGRNDRAYAVSYNRPIDINSRALQAGPQDFIFGEELPAIMWLEQNGYDVSYISSIDAATNPNSVLNAKVYMDVGHDEYWSQSQYANVQAAGAAGVNLMFLSGNEAYWDVSYTPSMADGTANRTIVEYKDPWSGQQLDPTGTADGGSSTFRDPVYGPGTPENGLTGSLFQVDDMGTLKDITLTSNYSKLFVWENTAAANLTGSQTLTLNNLLGYEWDADNNNGFRPAGLIDLSATTTQVGSLIINQAGTQVGSGTATHNLTLYRDTTSGALVFGAGTVMWSWGLSGQHSLYEGLTAPTSPVVQQSMVNLLAEMGVQPQTLQTSLVYASQSSDTSPPVSTISSVAGGQTLYSDQIARITGTASDVGGGNVAVVEISTDGGNSWSRANGTTNWSYSWIVPQAGNYTILTRAVDDTAHLETPSDAVTISVAQSSLTSILSRSPGDPIPYSAVSHNDNSGDPNSAELGVKFTVLGDGKIEAIRFYKAATDTGPHSVSLWSSSGTLIATASSTNETASGWQTITFNTPVAVTAGTTYVASYHSSGNYVLDTNYFVGPMTTTSLSTAANAGVMRTGTTSAFPNQSTAAGQNFWVDVEFLPAPAANADTGFTTTENTALSIPTSALLANDTGPVGATLTVTGVSSPVNGTATLDTSTNTITFTPTTGFAGAAGFTYTMSDGQGDTASAQVVVAVNPPGTVENLFPSSTVPTDTTGSDPSSVELGVKFTAAIDGQVTGVSFYKNANDTGSHTGTLWSSTGTALATGTFIGETSSGWQTLTFSTPVSITAGTTYVASFHSNGNYALSPSFFTSPYTNGDLTAPADAGVYTYGSSSVFPTSSYNATNYDVSVQFVAPPQNQPVARDDSGFTTSENTALSISAASLLANDTDPNGDTLTVTGVSSPVNGTATFDATTNTITFTPATGFAGAAGFAYTISDGTGNTASAQVAVAVNPPGTMENLFPSSTVPTQTSEADPNPVELGVKFTAAVDGQVTGVSYYKSANDTGTHTGTLWTSTGTVLATGTFIGETSSGWQTLTFSTPVSITAGTAYVASFHSNGNYAATPSFFTSPYTNGDLTAPVDAGVYAYGSSGTFPTSSYNATNYDVSVQFAAPTNRPPVANNDSGFTTTENTALSISASSLLANDTDPNGDTLTVTGVSSPVNGTATFDPTTNAVTFTPTTGFAGSAGFTYSISDGNGGTASAQVAVAVDPTGTIENLFPSSTVPTVTSEADPSSVELGVKFSAAVDGQIIGVSYYKSANDTGTHTGTLWTSTGTVLATGTFIGETSSGWQTLTFSTPVSITAGTTYLASFHSNGNYAATPSFFTSPYTNGDLTAPVDAGVYAYGSSSVFPTSSSTTNYDVSVQFAAPTNRPPVANNDSGFTTTENTALSISASSLLANDTDPNGDTLTVTGVSSPVNGTATFDPTTNAVTFTPTTGFVGSAGFTYSISDGNGGTASAQVAVTVDPSGTIENLFPSSTVPTVTSEADPSSVELGVKFSAAVDGQITGVSYYKSANDSGTHTGTLWSSTGTVLATGTFTGETSSGWQTLTFSTPVSITAGTTYVASFHSNGNYAATPSFFTSPYTNGDLTAPVDAGVYAYGSSSVFPTSSYNSTNYDVSVQFAPASQTTQTTTSVAASSTLTQSTSTTQTLLNQPLAA